MPTDRLALVKSTENTTFLEMRTDYDTNLDLIDDGVALRTVPAADNNLAKLDLATGDIEDAGLTIDQLSRRAGTPTSGHVATVDGDGDVTDGGYALTEILRAGGSVALSANWDAGSYEIRAQTLQSDVATGTAPLTVASTTKVTNLNADKFEGMDATAVTTKGDLLVASAANVLARVAVGSNGQVLTANSSETAGVAWTSVGGSWTAASETWTYASADDPTYTFTITGDYSGVYWPGQKIKLTNAAAVKYFIITKVAYVEPTTTVTVYGGTDYDLADSAITATYYSTAKAPYGFPQDPALWTVSVTDTSDRSQASATQNVWYNLGSVTISIPIGCWDVDYSVYLITALGVAGLNSGHVTLSTANNSESDTSFTSKFTSESVVNIGGVTGRQKMLNLASKTSYYLNTRHPNAGTTSLYNYNSLTPALIRARCAYL